MAVMNPGPAAFAARCPAHAGGPTSSRARVSLSIEHQAGRLKIELVIGPRLAPLQKVSTLLPQCMCSLYGMARPFYWAHDCVVDEDGTEASR